MGMMLEKNNAFRLAGQFQQKLLAESPYKTKRRFLHPQWTWAVGHIGLLYQLIRWFMAKEPETRLVLLSGQSAHPYFLSVLTPYVSFLDKEGPVTEDEVMRHAVYFGCPDGINTLVNFYKMIEHECKGHLLNLQNSEVREVDELLRRLGIQRPYVAVHARATANDPDRNVTIEQVEEALEEFKAKDYSVVSTGLDQHPINDKYPSIFGTTHQLLASFLLSAGCDHFVGSDSGAWTVAHAYGKPVTLMNDYQRNAWIYSGA